MNVDDETWNHYAPLLQQALDRAGNLHSLDDVRERVAEGHAQMWAGRLSVMITEVLDYPRYKVLNVWLAAGDLNEITRAGKQLDKFAELVGAKAIHMNGRLGWQRVLKEHGYTVTAVELMRTL